MSQPHPPKKRPQSKLAIEICALLSNGRRAAEVARRLNVSREYVYSLARLHGLPTNRTVLPGGPLAAKIVGASRVCTVTELARLYSQTPTRIQKILAASDKLARSATTMKA